jgi:hypothetical protein
MPQITIEQHQQNENHFYNLGNQAFEIFRDAGALQLIQSKERRYNLNSIDGDDKTKTAQFSYSCWSQGEDDLVSITLPYSLIDNFNHADCLELAIKQREANEAAEHAKKAKAAEDKANDNRRTLAKQLIEIAARHSEEVPGSSSAIELATPFRDELLNEMINNLQKAN